ncbi:3-phenylpropionate/cinnamic acid dioxygenase subunit beta [Insolitispirillum peregrinum]|uniref:Phenylpropionate dioxygenase beta subunit n=1 Tax=Insolitispirillum peregrinum TaxID=80876 RepID=A0A1N7NBM1_9PROT|nr:3-phenylpropionate/cinnamic acid dioxygenase subunit beta [Insolitispirillum peregrinum]SIS95785.1 phenylpropionate dioxygenase beta subunit [Insolitispirillum peregrinum]
MAETMTLIRPPVEAAVSAAAVTPELQFRIEQFLYLEAALLDERQFRQWLDLVADDISYVLMTNTLAQTRDRRKGQQPPTTYIFNESKYQLERRIARLETGMAWSEEPASRTRHFVSNVRVLELVGDEVVVSCNYLVHRAAKHRDHHDFIGTRRDRLRRVETPAGWELVRRDLELDQFVLTAPNISIIL